MSWQTHNNHNSTSIRHMEKRVSVPTTTPTTVTANKPGRAIGKTITPTTATSNKQGRAIGKAITPTSTTSFPLLSLNQNQVTISKVFYKCCGFLFFICSNLFIILSGRIDVKVRFFLFFVVSSD